MALVNAERFGSDTAVLDGDVELSYRDVADQSVAAARSLLACGVGQGDRVALWAPNMAEWKGFKQRRRQLRQHLPRAGAANPSASAKVPTANGLRCDFRTLKA